MDIKLKEGWVRGAIIGAGAHGIVSLAMNSSNGQLFAVKSATGSSWALDNEYEILQCMDSPYIVRCLGRNYSVENGVGTQNLFMEYMPGGSVGDLLIKFGGRLNESVIKAYTHGILCGIHYLHRQGIVHCDIKGKNVLVGANGVKLADFGSAKRLGDEKEGQETLQLRGTPLWMAPEVLNQVEQGPASDIWSLGCTVLEMATGRHPWSHVSNSLAAIYQIGCTEELPELPASLSSQIQDFLEKCFRRDPKKRWTSAELLNHPFLNEDCSTIEKEAIRGPGSPTSNLDFRNQVWDSYQTIPISSLGIPNPTGESNAQVNRSMEQRPSPSPRERIMALAAGCKSGDVNDWPNWSAIPNDRWVVVRSSRGNSFPTSDNPLSELYISNGFSTQELQLGEENCSASLKAANWGELQPRGELVECLDDAVSAAQPELHSSSSTYAETLHHDSFPKVAASHLIDEAFRNMYGSSSQSNAGGDPGIHSRLALGETFYIFDDKCTCTSQAGASCCHFYSSMCTAQFCHRCMIKGQLYISSRADSYPSCKFDSILLPTEYIRLHI